MKLRHVATAIPLLLAACGGVQMQPANPAVTARIVAACLGSGLFKAVDGALSAAVPVAALPVMVLNAGVDRVCANPEAFAADVSTVEWVAKNLAAVVRRPLGALNPPALVVRDSNGNVLLSAPNYADLR